MPAFKLMTFPFTKAQLHEMEYKDLYLEQCDSDRKERICRFDTIPTYSKLDSYRKKHRLSQADMAKLMDVSKRSYCDYESGQTQIPFKALRQLAKVTDLDFNEFIVGDVNRANKSHSIDIIRQTRKIFTYCLKSNTQISETEAFSVAEKFIIEYGVDTNLLDTGLDEGGRIEDCIKCVTYDPEAQGIFE